MSKNFLYRMLNNRAYIGEAVHKGTGYAGEHERLIDQRTWNQVQSILQQSPRLRANNTRTETPAEERTVVRNEPLPPTPKPGMGYKLVDPTNNGSGRK
jgi:site-specific DNA recombinase